MATQPRRAPTTSRAVWLTAVAVSALTVALATRVILLSSAWIGQVFPGFVAVENRIVASVGLRHWSGAAVPQLHWSELIAVDGAPVASIAEVYDHAAQAVEGTPIRYEIRNNGATATVFVNAERFTALDWAAFFLPFILNGVITIACGLIVWVLGPQRPVARAFLALGAINGLFFLTTPEWYLGGPLARVAAVTEGLLAGGVMHLALLFPKPGRHVRWRFAGYGICAAVVVARLSSYDDPPLFLSLSRLNYALIGAAVTLLLGRLLWAYKYERAPLARQRARLVSIGGALGIVLPGLILAFTVFTSGRTLSNVGAFMPFLFVVSVAYAIVEQDLFEIDAMVKRGAYYLVLTGVVAATYLAAVLLFHQLLRAGVVSDSAAFPVIFTLAVLLVLNPLRTRLQAVVDRVFFGAHYDAPQVLSEAVVQLASALKREDIVRVVREHVDRVIPNAGTQLLDEVPAALAPYLARGRVVTTADPPEAFGRNGDYAAVRAALSALHAEIVVPIGRGEEVRGLLAAGPKKSGVFYRADDAEFLRALAQSAAIALQNAASYEALSDLNAHLEDEVRSRTAQLVQSEKMAALGRLVAGVAHEINNPVSFVASTVDPLRDRLQLLESSVAPDLQGRLREARELVDIMARGAERTAAIVRDLRAFSRTDEETRKPVDLNDAIDLTLRLLEPRWRERVVIHRDFGALPAIDGDPGQLNQVLMNVIANACDAVGDSGNVWVSTRAEGDRVRVSVRDDGCGMSPEVQQRIVDPVFTTKDVGQGTGLGLALTHEIIRGHDGRIEVRSEVGHGSVFERVVPVRAAGKLDRQRSSTP